MSDSSQVRVSIVAESTFGVTPNSPTMLVLPITGVSIQDRIGYVQSNIISYSRDVADLVRLDKAAGGGVPCELRYSPNGEGLNAAIAAMLCNTFTSATSEVTGCEILGAAQSAISATGVGTGIEVGDIVRIRSSSNELLGYARTVSRSSDLVTVQGDFGDVSGAKVLRGARIKNGTTKTSFTVEVAYLDLQMAHIFTGCYFSQCDLNVAIGQLTTANFSIEGKTSTRVDDNTGTPNVFITGASYTDPSTHPSLDPIGVQEIQVGGNDYAASSVSVSLNNNVRMRQQLGTLGAVSAHFGQFGANGRVSAYFEDFADHDAFAENEATDLWYAQVDENLRGYSISYPQAKWSNVSSPVNGNNQDVFKNVDMQAILDPVEECTIRLQRWD